MIQRALIVDDDPLVQRVMAREILKGYQVVLARSGEEAMGILARAEGVRVVISDRDLGAGPDGLQILQCAKDLDASGARILVTGSIPQNLAEDAIHSRVAHYVFIKPWDRGAILEAVHTILSGAVQDEELVPAQSEVRSTSPRIIYPGGASRLG
jgi:DNA-binding NtrC family response regulator